MLLADTFPVFGWGASGYLLEGGAEAAFAGKSCSEADLLNGGVGGFQQEFCVVHTGLRRPGRPAPPASEGRLDAH